MPPQENNFQSFNNQTPTAPPPINVPTAPKHSSKRYGFLIVIVAILIVTGAFGVWYFSNLQSEEVSTDSISKPMDWQQTYENGQYGFEMTLTDSWKGYSVTTADRWEGYTVDGAEDAAAQTGPKVTLRHPNWDSNKEEIPVMMLTPQQWDLVTQGKIAIGAAPVPPSKLGQNSKYIFALPARYNFGFNSEEAATDAEKIVSTFRVVATSTPESNMTGNSGIRGRVILNPTCPAQKTPADPECASKPFQASFIVKDKAGKFTGGFGSDKDGTFIISLAPGKYTLQNIPVPGTYPYFREQNTVITVSSGVYTDITLQFDGGVSEVQNALRDTGQFCNGPSYIKCPIGYECTLKYKMPNSEGTCRIKKVLQDPGAVCAQVITPAKNIETGETFDFPTPCDVPEGWELIKN